MAVEEPVLAEIVPPQRDCPWFILLSALNLVTVAILYGPPAAWLTEALRGGGRLEDLSALSRRTLEACEGAGPAWWLASLALIAAGAVGERRIASRKVRLWAMGLTTAAVVLCFPLVEGFVRWMLPAM